MTVIYNATASNPKYILYNDPTPAGLGNNKYLFAMWKNV